MVEDADLESRMTILERLAVLPVSIVLTWSQPFVLLTMYSINRLEKVNSEHYEKDMRKMTGLPPNFVRSVIEGSWRPYSQFCDETGYMQ